MNRAQLIIGGVIVLLVAAALLLITGVLPGLKTQAPSPFTLAVWGAEADRALWDAVGERYRETQGSATIEYAAHDPARYEVELLNALAAGEGPDLFVFPDEWLARHRDKLAALGEGELGYERRAVRSTLADAAADAVVDPSGSLLASPIALDVLALLYNRDAFNAANIPSPPATWPELESAAAKLTKISAVGGIERSGAAIGTAENVDHAAEILGALIYQSGGEIVGPNAMPAINQPATRSALAFYTAFADPRRKTYTWNAFSAPSLRAFAAGETAMAFGYAEDVPAIVAANPQLNFDVAALPQSGDGKRIVNIGRLRLIGVTRTSRQRANAWQFALWLAGREGARTYSDTSGLPPARRDLATASPPQEYLGAFFESVLAARILPALPSGSRQAIINDMIEAVASRRLGIDQAVQAAAIALRTALTAGQP